MKFKLTSALLFLLIVNGTYFYFGTNSIAEINRNAVTLYDKVVMSGTYAQMVRTDFSQYSSVVSLSLSAADKKERADLKAKIDEHLQTLEEDLAVVRERALEEARRKAVDEITKQLKDVEAQAAHLLEQPHQSADTRLKLVREWMQDTARVGVSAGLAALSDQVVADGYSFRESSVERSGFISKVSLAFGLIVLLTNIVCLVYILMSILPRLKKLSDICAEIINGAFSLRISIHGTDEFDVLSRSFNKMLDIIDRRDRQIRDQLLTTNAMMNSLSQGFVMVDRSGMCLPNYSKACVTLLESSPAGRPLAEVLRIPTDQEKAFNEWFQTSMLDADTFEMLRSVGNKHFTHSQGLVIELEYLPLCDEKGALTHMIVTATDVTKESKARAIAEREQAFSRMVSKLTKNKRQFSRFLVDANTLLSQIAPNDAAGALRTLHTIKGGASTFSMARMKEIAHHCETELIQIRNQNPSSQELAQKIETAAAAMREAYRTTLQELKDQLEFFVSTAGPTRELPTAALLVFYQRLTASFDNAELKQEFVQNFLLEPIGSFVTAYNETIHDISNRQAKRVHDLQLVGADLSIFPDQYSDLFASLVHVFRNAIDHGVEQPDVRRKHGKDPVASIRVVFAREFREGQPTIKIAIHDDGRGIDPKFLRGKLREKGIATDRESDFEVLQHVFDAQVSTAETITDISGRGIGLDAVKSAALALGGTAHIESVAGQGTSILISVPEKGPEARSRDMKLNRAS